MRVSRAFGPDEVLSNVTFEVRPGDIHGLIGPNGVGKTTLLRIVAGLMEPTTGSVSVLGRNPMHVAVRRQIGWIPGGERTFYLRLSGLENLVFFGRMYGMTANAAKTAGLELIDMVGLTSADSRPTGLYSKGMLKRLAVARALLPEPRILLCDETTHDLDPDGSAAILGMFADLARDGLSVIWATQRLDELVSFADTVTVLTHGGVAFTGLFRDLVERIPSRSFEIRLAEPITPGVLEVLDALGVTHSSGDDPEYQVVVQVSQAVPIGRVVAALTEIGHMTLVVNETGSHVEAAYHHVLRGSEPT
jgi:ABC-type multidrug transport system ATPase subunit